MVKYDLKYGLLIGTGLLTLWGIFSLFQYILLFNMGVEITDVIKASILSSSATLTLVSFVALQLLGEYENLETQRKILEKEKDYLSRFNPSLHILEECQPVSITGKNPEARITIVNTSQSALVIESISLEAFDHPLKPEALTTDGTKEANSSDSIIIEPNEMKDLRIKMHKNTGNPFSEEQKEILKKQKFIFVSLSGNFEKKLLKIPLNEEKRQKRTLKVLKASEVDPSLHVHGPL